MCSTNGLALPQHMDELLKYNIDHVTITINCIDPDIGAKIYPWIFWNNRRIKGRKAAKVLIQQQQKGLQMLVEKGILVKVNSVLIPGVNDEHLKEVSKLVKEKDAFLHNVMPLIAEAEHGTFYGVMGQRGPTHTELKTLQDACAGDMNMMRHCRHCRADAVGMLGEDRGDEFSLDKIKDINIDYKAAMKKRAAIHHAIEEKRMAQRQSDEAMLTTNKKDLIPEARPVLFAIASSGGGVINQHFGHAKKFLIYEASPMDVRFIGQRKVELYCNGHDSCAETESTLDKIIRALEGCEAVLCSKIGIEPWSILEQAGI